MKDMAAASAETRMIVAADWQLIDDEFYIEKVWKPARKLGARPLG